MLTVWIVVGCFCTFTAGFLLGRQVK